MKELNVVEKIGSHIVNQIVFYGGMATLIILTTSAVFTASQLVTVDCATTGLGFLASIGCGGLAIGFGLILIGGFFSMLLVQGVEFVVRYFQMLPEERTRWHTERRDERAICKADRIRRGAPSNTKMTIYILLGSAALFLIGGAVGYLIWLGLC